MSNLTSHLPDALAVNDHTAKLWVEQQIWGHRLHNDQTPWLLLLEAIGVMAHLAKTGTLLTGLEKPGNHEVFTYNIAIRQDLRAILFKDRHIEEIAESNLYSDQSRWSNWYERLSVDDAKRLSYLQERFTSFTGFRNAVTLLRSAEVEADRKRRASSRHLSPRGPDMMTADYGEPKKKGNQPGKDRRFFARGGELLYLMLNRSHHRSELHELVQTRLLSAKSRWNALAKLLQPSQEQTPELSFDNVGYLPLPHHQVYDLIAEDWLAVLSLKALPDDSLPDPLMRLTGLGIIQYMTRRSAEIVDKEPPVFPLAMVSIETVAVQKLSKDCFARHRDQSRDAVGKLVDDLVCSDDWAAALGQQNPLQAIKSLLKNRFMFECSENAIEKIPEAVREEAIGDHEMHLGRVVGFYAEQIGMAASRRGSGRWYAASDALLEALVLANVTVPMEFEMFLDRLWQRYRVVVGIDAAKTAFSTSNYTHHKANQRLLEERLRILGLAKRLSDDCAFVINPFHG